MPPHETDWKIVPEDFSRLLRRDWIVVMEKIPDTLNPDVSGRWVIRFGVYDAQLCAFHDSNALHMDADVWRAVILAYWHRQFVPPDIELHLVDGEGNWSVLIEEPFLEGQAFARMQKAIEGETPPFWVTEEN
jgi:hypothetical protein